MKNIREVFYLLLLLLFPLFYFYYSIYFRNSGGIVVLIIYVIVLFLIALYFGRKIFDRYYYTDTYSIKDYNMRNLRNGLGAVITFLVVMASYMIFNLYESIELENNSKEAMGVIVGD